MSNDSENKFDELFRNRFEEAELPVSDKLLSNLKKELGIEEKKKRRFGFWIWLLGGLCVVAFGAGTVFYFNNNQTNSNFSNTHNSNPTIDTVANTSISTEDRHTVVSGSSSDKSINTVASEPQQEQQEVKENMTESDVTAKQQDSKQQSATLTFAENKNSSSVTNTATTVSKTSKTKQENKDSKPLENTVAKTSKAMNGGNKKTATTNTENNTSITTKKQSVEIKTTDEPADSITEKKSLKDSILSGNQTATPIHQPDSMLVAKDTAQIAQTKPKADSTVQENKPKEPQKNAKSSVFYIEANGGLSQAFRMLENQSAFDRTGETPWFTYNAGIDAGVLFKNKYQMSIGLGIDNKGEKYKFFGKEAEYETTVDQYMEEISIPIVDTNNMDTIGWYQDSVWVSDTNTILVQTEIPAKSVTNSYQYVKLPIMFGYRFNVTDKFFITPNAGVLINYLVTAQATWYDPQLQQYIIYDTRDKYRTIVLAARAKIDIGYSINEKWSILLQPAYTRYLNSIFRKEDYFKQYPYSYDVNMGIRYTF